MKKLTLITTAMTALMATSTTTSAFAADPTPAHSTGHISLLAGDDTKPTDPVDPDDPGTGNTGDLTLDVVPNFEFGEVHIGDTTPASDTNNQHLQTTDKRGTGNGWIVSVKYVADDKGTAIGESEDAAWKNSDGSVVGSGFTLKLPEFAKIDISNGSSTDYNKGSEPTGTAITVNNGAQTISTAGKDAGMGTWVQGFATAATLQVPGNNKAGDYTANLEWTIADTPA